jgi:hypothetical protein
MPYKKVKTGDKWKVVKEDDESKEFGTHDSEAEADAQLAALYANEDKVEKFMKFEKFVQLAKVDLRTHTVWGIATSQDVDSVGEAMHYEKSKPNFVKWSQQFAKATGGRSFGNVRGMHQSTAAGKIIHFELRDAKKEVYIGAEIVDPGEWEKCEKGVYTGFSIGGSYGERWDEGGVTYYEAIPSEISLVDNPCNKAAVFEFVKMDGSVERRHISATNEETTDMKKVFPPAKPGAPADEEKKESPFPPAAAAEGKENPAAEPAPKDETPPGAEGKKTEPSAKAPAPEGQDAAAEPSKAMALIDAAVADGTLDPDVAKQLKAAIAEEESGEGAMPGMGESGMPAAQSTDEIRALVLDLLVEVGLVERVGEDTESRPKIAKRLGGVQPEYLAGEMRKIGDSHANALQKALDQAHAELDDASEQINLRVTRDINALAKDIAKIYADVDTRLAKVTGLGPVVREIGALTSQSIAKTQEIVGLQSLLAGATTEKERQDILNRITQIEISRIQK